MAMTTQKKPQTPVRGIGAQQPVPDYANNPQYKQLNQQRSQVLSEIHRRGGIAKTPGFATKLNDLNTQIRGMRKGVPGTGGGLFVENGQPPAPTPPTPDPNAQPSTNPVPDDAQKALYPGMSYQLPENYQGSPMYQWQMDQGNKMLTRRLAANGLMGSGREMELAQNLAAQVGAQESDRLRNDMQTEADRYERVSTNEANRQVAQGNSQWGRLMDVLNLGLGQSPMGQAYQGLGQYGNLDMSQGKANAANTANNYTRVSGGGGRAIPGFTPPQPTSPNHSQSDMMAALFGNTNSRSNGSILDSLIGSIFG